MSRNQQVSILIYFYSYVIRKINYMIYFIIYDVRKQSKGDIKVFLEILVSLIYVQTILYMHLSLSKRILLSIFYKLQIQGQLITYYYVRLIQNTRPIFHQFGISGLSRLPLLGLPSPTIQINTQLTSKSTSKKKTKYAI